MSQYKKKKQKKSWSHGKEKKTSEAGIWLKTFARRVARIPAQLNSKATKSKGISQASEGGSVELCVSIPLPLTR